jgi:hypothetical protein
MKRCPVCGLAMRTVALTALEEQAQTYPHVSAAWRCSAWPACDTRRVEEQTTSPCRGFYRRARTRRAAASARCEDRPRDSDIGGPAWGTKR